MKVLIADDDPMFRHLLNRQLQAWGYETVVAEDGIQAWNILRAENAPHIAILDWQMPGQDGIDICRRLRSQTDLPFIYTIMLTTRDTREDTVLGLEAGADDYLAKPVDSKLLQSHLAVARRIVEAVPPREWSLPRLPGYEVIRLLGRGMSGTVWEAVHQQTQRRVALKIIRRDLVTAEILRRFTREIEVTRKLNHPNIAQVYDSRFDENYCYYAMELIQGTDLGRYVAEVKPNQAQTLLILLKVCDGVEHAHQNGIVHRDLKPANILMTRAGEPKVVDFGLAKRLLQTAATEEYAHTLQDVAIGTPMYMAPEQARGQNDQVDARSDVYALGVILYLLLTGHHPQKLNRTSRWEFVRSIAQSEVRAPHLMCPSIDPALEAILLKALSRQRCDRYPSAGALGEAIRQYLQGRAKEPPG